MKKHVTVLFMRHGFSMLNYMATIRPKEANRFDTELIDCTLHEKGILQCKEKSASLNAYKNIAYVFISPLVRARQTAYLITKEHPNGKSIHYFIHPLITEIVSRSNDIPQAFKMLPDEKSDLKFFPEHSDPHYYLKGLKYEKEIKEKYSGKSPIDVQKGIALKMSELYPIDFETEEECCERTRKFLKFIRQFIMENNASSNQILVVTHSQIMKNIKEILNIKGEVDIPNCSVLEVQIEI